MLPVSGSKIPQTSNTSTSSKLLTQIDAIHEQARGEGQSIVQASENCVVSNQLYGENHTVTTNFFLTASDSNARLIFEKLNVSAEATRYKPLAQLGPHIEELRAAYLNVLEEVDEIRDGLTLYIPSEGQETADSKISFTLIEKVRDFLSSNKKVLLLLGEAGSGKSTFNRELTRTLWGEYQPSSTAPIPIFIALAEHTPSCKDLIESYLLEQEFSPEEIALLRKEKRLVFILDGFDEIEDRTQAFYTQHKLDHWKNAQVIISSRPEYLGKNYRIQFQKRGQTSALQEYWLSPTSDDWITAYIQKYIRHTERTEWNLKRYQDALNNLPTLKEAIRRPFLLRMALDLLPDLTASKSGPVTRIALYDAFISRWWNRSEERLLHITLTSEEEKARCKLGQSLVEKGLRASQEMAMALTQKRLVQAFYDPEKEDVIPEAWRTYLNEKDAEKRLLLFNAPLIHQGQHYRFIHKSIQDYCVARAICGPQFNSAQPGVNAALNQFLLVDEPLILDFLAERVKQHPSFKAHLHAWIESSKDPSFPVTVGAANAITILVRAGVQFNGADLKGIRIPGADLSYGVFDLSQLQGSDLSGTNLYASWLRQADLSGAQMAGVQFGEWPYLKEESSVRSCVYSPDGKTFAVNLGYAINVYDVLSWEKIYTLSDHEQGYWDHDRIMLYSPNSQQIATYVDTKYDIKHGNTEVRLWDMRSGQLSRTLSGHSDKIYSVMYSPDGVRLASGSKDQTVRLWNVETGATLYTLCHTEPVDKVIYLPRGQQIAFCTEGGVWLWDVETAVARYALNHTKPIYEVIYSHSGQQIAARSSSNILLWNVQSGQLSRTLSLGKFRGFIYSPNDQQIASYDWESGVSLWDVQSGELIHNLNNNSPIRGVVYSPNSQQLASYSSGNTIHLWDVQSGQLNYALSGHTDLVRCIVYSPDGQQLASGSDDHTVRLWDAQIGQYKQHTSSSHSETVYCVAYSPNGQQIVSCSYDHTVKLWDVQSGQLNYTLSGHTRKVECVIYSPNGEQIASGSGDNTVRLWDARSGQLEHILSGHTHSISCIVYAPDGQQIASGGEDSTIHLWDAQSGQSIDTLSGHTLTVCDIAYSPDGQQLASGGADYAVRLWDVQSRKLRFTLCGHTNSALKVTYSSDGEQIASGSTDGTVCLWGVRSGERIHILRGHRGFVDRVVYSPQGDQLASGSNDNTVRLWDVKNGACLRILRVPKTGYIGINNKGVTSLVYSPKGDQIVFSSGDRTVRLWDVETGRCQMTIQSFNGMVRSVAWKEASNGHYLATGDGEGFVRQWQIIKEEDQYKASLCWSSGHPLTTFGTFIQGVRGLSKVNEQLLKQRGAVSAYRDHESITASFEENAGAITSEEDISLA
ncbi:NACHT domain-containing protein [Mycoavidus sp. B2-EB]|uniref:NACHT and WD40 repeat domain-containing protein n=1 Tax=Mycoavidus sp. B2-EB TaxID=2651972 RepID=UPI0030886013|nr:hypothetical protein MPB2EB_0366 [Mycoavidus sp. B2-EB]